MFETVCYMAQIPRSDNADPEQVQMARRYRQWSVYLKIDRWPNVDCLYGYNNICTWQRVLVLNRRAHTPWLSPSYDDALVNLHPHLLDKQVRPRSQYRRGDITTQYSTVEHSVVWQYPARSSVLFVQTAFYVWRLIVYTWPTINYPAAKGEKKSSGN